MSEVRKLHDEAMALAEMASVAKLKGDLEQAGKLLRQAYDKESKAAELITREVSLEPTRSILFRSAASLAIDCNEFREAERLIATALSGNPPADIAEELRDLSGLIQGKGKVTKRVTSDMCNRGRGRGRKEERSMSILSAFGENILENRRRGK